ncbi:hypothetical protein [Halobaculum sp. P14]|uniref:hypothetical protein n=1 Tax=Halobaculum sp. P14 TaxID=3421638 RepID=UPI003EBE6E67
MSRDVPRDPFWWVGELFSRRDGRWSLPSALGRHVALPVVVSFAYLSVLGAVTEFAGGVHWTLSLVTPVAVAVAAGLVGLAFPAVVVEAYAVDGAIAAGYVVFGDGADAFASTFAPVVADHSALQLAVAVPAVLFGVFGPLLVVLAGLARGRRRGAAST